MPSGFDDTISSASSYYNNQYRVDPGFVQAYAKIHKRDLTDTLETKQQRLERHLETQFQLNQQVPSGKIVLFAQVGKYAILALVMPPFYLFYEGPRWILITIQPLFLIAFEKSGTFLLLISTFAIDFWAGLRKKLQFFKKPKDLLKEKMKVLNQAVLKRMAVLGQKIYKIFQPMIQVMGKLQSFIPVFREKRAEFVHFLKILPLLLQKQFISKKERFKTVILEKSAAVMAVLAKVQIPFIAVKKILDPVIQMFQKQAAKIIKPVLRVATQALVTSRNAMKRLFEQSKVVGNIITLPFNLAIKATAVPIKNTVKHIGKTLLSLKKKIGNQTESVVKLMKAATVAAVIPLQKGFVQFKIMGEKVGINFIEKAGIVLERLKKMQPIVKRLIKTLWDEGKRHSKKGFIKFKKNAIVSARTIAKALVWGFEKIGKIPSKFYSIWKKFQKWIVRLAKRAIWAIRLTVAWTKVLLRYSLRHLWD